MATDRPALICWSIAQMTRKTERDTVLHLQGDEYGKSRTTLCGQPYGVLWDYEVDTYPDSKFVGCKRCMAVICRMRKAAQ